MKISIQITVVLLCLCLAELSARAGQPPISLELLEVNKIWDNAPHNAFTDLVRFEDQWYLGLREATSHAVSGNGDVRVIRSVDGNDWESVALLDYGPGWDMRDAKLHVTGDGRLMLNTAAAPLSATNQRQSLCWFTDDGNDWSDGPYEVGETDWWLWGLEVHPDGTTYGVGYGDIKTHPRTTRLYKSTNGIDYETIVPTLTSDPETGEVSIIFRADGTALALVRDNTGAERSLLGTSSGDYTDWSFKVLDKRVGGPELIELPDGNILAATRLHSPTVRTSLSWIDPEAGQIIELLTLPSGGDTSYPGLVWHDDLLWMSYYSSHEGKTSIYLAKVKVTPTDPAPAFGVMRFQEENQPHDSYTAEAAHIRTDITEGESDLVIVGETAEHIKTLRGVFGFDLSDLPQGAHITGVSFTLFANRDGVDGVGGSSVDGDFILDLHRLESSFDESEVSWNERLSGEAWNQPGGDFDAEPLSSLVANPRRLLSDGLSYTWAGTAEFILAAQQAFHEGESLDMLLRTPDGEAQDSRVIFYFHSDDSTDPAQHPLFTVTYTTLAGDANADGIVDDADATILASNWQTLQGAMWTDGDFNGDGAVDDADATILATNWQAQATRGQVTQAPAVPEPHAIAMLLGGLFCLLSVAPRKRAANSPLKKSPRDN